MKTRTKIVVSFLVLLIVLIAIATTLIAVLALTSQTISANLSIGYSATRDVHASITGNVHTAENSLQEFSVNIDETGTSGDINLDSFTIDPDDPEKAVRVDLGIKNTQPNATNSNLYVNPVITHTKKENITIEKLVSFEDSLNYEEFTENNVLITHNQTVYIRLKFRVTDGTKDADLQGKIDLNFYTTESVSLPEDVATSTIAGVGHYPQAYVGNTLNETLKATTLTATGKSYTTDVNGTETTLTEYTYQGKKVAKLENSQRWASNYYFSTGDSVNENQTYFFYVRPITVTAVEYNLTMQKIVYISKLTVFSRNFETATTGSNDSSWNDSEIRVFLNGDFLTESGINASRVTIKNDATTGTDIVQTDTNDKIWLPSKNELNTWYSSNNLRKKKPTDMVMASFAIYKAENNAGFYYTRSAYNSDYVYRVDSTGEVNKQSTYNGANVGISFCFAM